ncbi:hypothetical protein GCM10010193_09880 [Kitasatospora atroaurantiaca]
MGQQAAGCEAEAAVPQGGVGQDGEIAHVRVTMNLHWEPLLLVSDPGVLAHCRGQLFLSADGSTRTVRYASTPLQNRTHVQ